MSKEERERGILTPADRGYLTGESDVTDGTAYNIRRRIRQRVRDAMLDFEILVEHLPAEDRARIFGSGNTGYHISREPDADDEPAVAIADAIAFMLLGITDHHDLEFQSPYAVEQPTAPQEELGHHSEPFEYALYQGLHKGYWERDVALEDMNLDIQSTRLPGLSKAKQRLEEGKDIPPKMVKVLIEAGEIDNERLQEFFREELGVTEERND